MMGIVAAFKYRQLGYRIRRDAWAEKYFLWPNSMAHARLSAKDILADDWEIITEGIIKDFPITYSDRGH